jgi:hypothetical protein
VPGEMQTTMTLQQVSVGTEVRIVQEGVPVSSQPRRAIWAGKHPSPCSRSSSRRRFQTRGEPNRLTPSRERTRAGHARCPGGRHGPPASLRSDVRPAGEPPYAAAHHRCHHRGR